MKRHVYSEINLHITWHVKDNLPTINDQIEPRLHRELRSYALKTKGLIFHEVGGIEDHVHIAVTIPPTVLISEFIGKLKGASAHYVNHELVNRKVLEWQAGYGVVSFGTKDLPGLSSTFRTKESIIAKEPPSTDSKGSMKRLTIVSSSWVCVA